MTISEAINYQANAMVSAISLAVIAYQAVADTVALVDTPPNIDNADLESVYDEWISRDPA